MVDVWKKIHVSSEDFHDQSSSKDLNVVFPVRVL